MKITFLLYPTSRIKVDEDSSFWMIHELKSRGHDVTFFISRDLVCLRGEPMARLRAFRTDPSLGFVNVKMDPDLTSLQNFDVIVIRKEPPFDADYLHALQILSLLPSSVRLINRPEGIVLCNEKLATQQFPKWTAESLVASCADELVRFIAKLGTPVVVKPLDQKGGRGIYKTSAKDPALRRKLIESTLRQSRPVIVQRFIPHRLAGDKRILLLNGDFLGCFTRKARPNEFRSNLSLGGTMHRDSLSAHDKKIVRTLRPFLRQHGLLFVGIDVIQGRLSEINVTSPSGIPELHAREGFSAEKKIADFIESYRPPRADRKRF